MTYLRVASVVFLLIATVSLGFAQTPAEFFGRTLVRLIISADPGGSERIYDPVLIEERVSKIGIPRENYTWYLDLRKYGSVPHAGFGLGLERTVAWICGLPHIRETIPYARLMNRKYP